MQSDAFTSGDFHQSATFASRGATVPFTTPLLIGGRVRHSKHGGTEFVIPNSSGGRGVCILPWLGVLDLCSPTMHDRILVQRISCLERIAAVNIRECALDVALEGYAGRKAAAAAEAARKRDYSRVVSTQSQLWAALIEHIEQLDPNAVAWPPDFEHQVGLMLRWIAPGSSCSPERLMAILSAMAAAFASIGVGADERTARIPLLVNRLTETTADIEQWLLDNPQIEMELLSREVVRAMTGALRGADSMLAQTRATLANPLKLLQFWIANLDGAAAIAGRCDWLLDGWELICLIWKSADGDLSRRTALLEMAQMLPIWPREARDWFPRQFSREAMTFGCKVVSRDDAWRSGAAALAMIQRNETMRAMSA